MHTRARGTPTALTLGLAALTAAACAGNPPPGDGIGDAFVVVDNTATTISDATIKLVDDLGVERRLGSVALNERKEFRVDTPLAGQYRLVADILGERDMVSTPFTLVEGDVVEWDLGSNVVGLEVAR